MIVELIALFAFVSNEQGFWATISIIVFGAALQWFGSTDIIDYVRTNPLTIVIGVVAYFVIGAIWGIVKWWIFCHDSLEAYKEQRDNWLRNHNVPAGTVPVELRTEWNQYISSNRMRISVPPQVRDHKADIIRWMAFWVVSIVWSFLDDFVKRIFRTIYQKLAKTLQGMSDNIFGDMRKDLEVPGDTKEL